MDDEIILQFYFRLQANRYTASHFSRLKQLTWRYAPYAITALKGRTAEARKSDSHSHSHSEYLRIFKRPKKSKSCIEKN